LKAKQLAIQIAREESFVTVPCQYAAHNPAASFPNQGVCCSQILNFKHHLICSRLPAMAWAGNSVRFSSGFAVFSI
tara:strand:- start:821 stop:1048 length:228 start_codon:yes stop_codon:yes gene_type:complete